MKICDYCGPNRDLVQIATGDSIESMQFVQILAAFLIYTNLL